MHPPDPSSFSAQRHATRAPVDLPVRLRADGEETLLEGRCNNVSIGGMFVETDAFCEAGQQMQFELQINEEQSIEGRAEVIWRQQGDLRRRPGVGFRFRYLEQRDRQAIFKLVSRHIKDRLAARQPRADDAVDPRAAGEPSPMLSAPEVVSLAAEDAAPPRSLGPDAATPEGPPTPPAFDVPPAAVPPVTVPLSPDELAAAFRPPAAASADAAAPSGAESSPGFRVFDDPEPAAAVVPSRLEDFAPNVSEASGVDLMPLASAAQARSPAEPALAGEAPAVPNAGPTLLDEGEPERPFGAEEGPLDSVEGPPAVAREPQPAAPQPQARSGVLELPDDFELRGAGAPTFDPVHPAVPARTDDPLPGRGDPFSGGRPSPRRDWPLPVILGLVLLLVGALAYLFGGHLFDLESGAARIERQADSRLEAPEASGGDSSSAGAEPPGATRPAESGTPGAAAAPPPRRQESAPREERARPAVRPSDPPPPPPPRASRSSRGGALATLERLDVRAAGGGVEVVITTSAPVAAHDHFRLEGAKPRIVVRLYGVRRFNGLNESVDRAGVSAARVGWQRDSGAGPQAHVVLDLSDPRAEVASTRVDGRKLIIRVEAPS